MIFKKNKIWIIATLLPICSLLLLYLFGQNFNSLHRPIMWYRESFTIEEQTTIVDFLHLELLDNELIIRTEIYGPREMHTRIFFGGVKDSNCFLSRFKNVEHTHQGGALMTSRVFGNSFEVHSLVISIEHEVLTMLHLQVHYFSYEDELIVGISVRRTILAEEIIAIGMRDAASIYWREEAD